MSDAQITQRTISADTRYAVTEDKGPTMSLHIGTFSSGLQITGEPEDLIRLAVSIREGVQTIINRREPVAPWRQIRTEAPNVE